MTASAFQQKEVEDLKQKRHLAARAMSQEEFDQLVADRHSLIVDLMCVSMSTSAIEVIVGSPANSDAPVDTPPTSGRGGGSLGA